MRCDDLEAVLLDMDGVVVDSREAWFRAFQEAAGVERATFEAEFWGRDLEDNLAAVGAEPRSFCQEVFPRHADAVVPATGARETLEALRAGGLMLALITNTTADCTRGILRRFGMDVLFDEIVTVDAVRGGKPRPDPIELACSRLDIAPGCALMVGDSAHDIAAGRRAGARTVGLGIDGDERITDIRELAPLLGLAPAPGPVAGGDQA